MTEFGTLLRSWRKTRRLSQMQLAMIADVSPRHISFLETGKATPSRTMVMRLAKALETPPSALNECLRAAGFAEKYKSRPTDDEELAPFIEAANRLLASHDPYPGWLIDADWRITEANVKGHNLLALLQLGVGDNLVEAVIADPTFGGVLVNWHESAAYLRLRLSSETRRSDDRKTFDLAQRISHVAETIDEQSIHSPAIPAILRIDGREARLVSMLCLFNTAQDLTLSSLRTELFHPIDEESRILLTRLI